MDREQFEAALDDLIAAHGRKVRAGIDAAACGTRSDWLASHKADDAYLEAHDAFLDEVFARPPPAPPPTPCVVGLEVRGRGRTRGRAVIWRRWVEVRLSSRGAVYTFTAGAEALTLDSSVVEAGDDADLRSPDFDPLDAKHSVRFRGLDYFTTDPAPPELVKLAIEACRGAARRLFARGVDHFAATREWPQDWPTFVELVKAEPMDSLPTRSSATTNS
jgi:hypothetical protein